ncbi:MAG TPA: ABC transporter permease [Verrucomicrobiae bacterium]|nr:ABC transporter permease [Verrucomicrobiae bacterium]
MSGLAKLGKVVWAQGDELRHAAAVIGTVLCLCVQPRYWARRARNLFARQVLEAGVEPAGFVCAVAAFVGMSVVVQLAFWTGEAGQSQLLGPLLVAVVARELGPLLTNVVVIVRSSSPMATELGVLKINGELRVLQREGNDPFEYLVMPRVLGLAVSTLCLTILFILVALASGYLFGAWLGTGSRDVWFFTNSVLKALHPQDIAGIVAKSILPALFTSASCCIGGLGVGGPVTDIPRATQRALTRSVAGLFVISAVVSLLSYL